MEKEEIIKTFKFILDKDKDSFITPPIGEISIMGQGINFDICNSFPENTKRTYFKIDSFEQAKEIWIEVLSDLPMEEVSKAFDKYIPDNLNIDTDLFLSIYSGQK